MQKNFGLFLIKYDTLGSGSVAAPWYYQNPLFDGKIPTAGALYWYIEHPLKGLLTIFMHLYSSFSVANFLTYIDSPKPWYSNLLCFVSWVLLVFGVRQGYLYLSSLTTIFKKTCSFPYALAVSFILLLMIAIAMLNSISAVELRFNIIPIVILQIFGINWLINLSNRRDYAATTVIILAISVALFGVAANHYIRLLGVPTLAVTPFDYAAHKCVW